MTKWSIYSFTLYKCVACLNERINDSLNICVYTGSIGVNYKLSLFGYLDPTTARITGACPACPPTSAFTRSICNIYCILYVVSMQCWWASKVWKFVNKCFILLYFVEIIYCLISNGSHPAMLKTSLSEVKKPWNWSLLGFAVRLPSATSTSSTSYRIPGTSIVLRSSGRNHSTVQTSSSHLIERGRHGGTTGRRSPAGFDISAMRVHSSKGRHPCGVEANIFLALFHLYPTTRLWWS